MATLHPTNTALDNLLTARKLNAGAQQRGRKAWTLLQEVRACKMWLSPKDVLATLTEAVRMDALMCGADQDCGSWVYDESATEVLNNLKAEHPTVFVGEDSEGLVLQPFFNEYFGSYKWLGLGDMNGCDPLMLGTLEQLKPDAPWQEVPQGLTAFELDTLNKMYQRETLKVLTTLRNLHTGCQYLVTGLMPDRLHLLGSKVPVKYDTSVHGKLAALIDACSLPILPAPCKHFGTEANRVNPAPAACLSTDTLQEFLLAEAAELG